MLKRNYIFIHKAHTFFVLIWKLMYSCLDGEGGKFIICVLCFEVLISHIKSVKTTCMNVGY